MNLDQYDLLAKQGSLNFEFFSEGPRGRIKKIIQFNRLNNMDNLYNLSFGDFREGEEKIDDTSVSNNGDSEKILITIAIAVKIFTDKFPNALVFAEGRTPSRTRYYIMKISKYLADITDHFEIWGAITEKEWEPFRKNIFYKALVARRKYFY